MLEEYSYNMDQRTKLQMALLKQQLKHPDLYYAFAIIDHQAAMNVS